MRGLSHHEGEASIDLDRLIEGVTYRVESTMDLHSGPWAAGAAFTASSTTTNLAVGLGAGLGFVRTTIP